MRQKGFVELLIIVGIILLLAVGGGAYYLGTKKSNSAPSSSLMEIASASPSAMPNEMANWKTYKDPKNRFEFKYPAEFKEVPFNAMVQFNKSGVVLAGYTEDHLRLEEFFGKFEQYELMDDPGGFIFRFDPKINRWVHKDGSTSQFIPKKANAPLEAYTYSSGDIKCSWDDIIIPTPSNESVILLKNVVCGTDEIAPDKNKRNERKNLILSTFKFTP